LGELKQRIDTFNELGISIAAISTDSTKQSRAVAREMNLPFDLLSDGDKSVINMYNLLNPFEHGGIAKPALFLVLTSGKITYRSIDGTARRADISELLDYLKTNGTDIKSKESSGVKKKWIIPTPKVSWQIARNMVLRGNVADWKHSLTFPYGLIKLSGKKILKAFSKGNKTE
jgi:alkyl hydroperoxide reductase subunit AhpC